MKLKKKDKKEGDKEEKNKEEKTKKDEIIKEVKIDFDGFEEGAVPLPPDGGNYINLSAVPGKVIYHRMPNSGSESKKNQSFIMI